MNRNVYEKFSSNPKYTCKLIKLDFARNLSDLQVVRIGKIFKAFSIFFKLCITLITFRPNKVYFSIVPHGFVLLRDSLYLFAIKILQPRVQPILHLHCPGLLAFRKKYNLDWFYRILFRRCRIIHLTKELLENEISTIKIKKAKLFVIPNFIEKPSQTIPIENKNKLEILFLANLLPQKGYLLILEAISVLTTYFPNIKLTLAGSSKHIDTIDIIKNKIELLNLNNNVKFVGTVEGIAKQQLFQRASIFVLPSKSEYFPLTILEAMSNKVAVITSGRQSLQSEFKDNEHLLYLDELSPKHIARKIEYLLLNHDKLVAIANGGYKRWQEIQENSHKKLESIMQD